MLKNLSSKNGCWVERCHSICFPVRCRVGDLKFSIVLIICNGQTFVDTLNFIVSEYEFVYKWLFLNYVSDMTPYLICILKLYIKLSCISC